MLICSLFDGDGVTKYMATGFYVTARLTIGALNLWFVFLFPHFRGFHAWNTVTAVLPISFWIGALWVPYPSSTLLQWLSFLFGMLSNPPDLNADWFPYYLLFVTVSLYGRITRKEKYYSAPLMNLMEYYPAVDMEQRTERTSNFITMVLGYIVVNLIYQSAAVIGFNAYDPLLLWVLTSGSWERRVWD
jgi:hypothetical protein